MSQVSKDIIISLIIFLSFISCSEKQKDFKTDITISVTIPPYADFVRKITGNKADIHVLIPAGTNVHSYEPNPVSLKHVYESDIYFRIGEIFQFENTILNKIGKENIKNIIDCSKGVKLLNNDPHIWLSPNNVKLISKNILNTLVKFYPQHKNYFSNNYDKFAADIDSIDKKINLDLKEKKNRVILVYHPAWQYFAEHYNLEEIAIERDGKEPKANDLKNFIELARSKGVKYIFFDPHFDDSSVLAIARSADMEIDSLNPLPEDFLKNLSLIGEKLKKYLE